MNKEPTLSAELIEAAEILELKVWNHWSIKHWADEDKAYLIRSLRDLENGCKRFLSEADGRTTNYRKP